MANLDFHKAVTILVLVEYSLQYVNKINIYLDFEGHNPCFSRNVFAIKAKKPKLPHESVTILVLVEYSLQYDLQKRYLRVNRVTILVLVEYSLQ